MPHSTKKLREVCDVFADGDWIESKDQSNAGIRLIQTGNIGEGIFLDKSGRARFISEDTFKHLNCTEIFPGDFLISRLPDPVGRACILPDTGSRMITAVDCTIVRVNQKILLPKYLLLFTQSREYYQQIEQQLSGSTRQRISRGNLGRIEIPLPPLAEQKKIVERIEKQFAKIDEAIRLRGECLAATEALLPATLHEIFEEWKGVWKQEDLAKAARFIDYRGKTPTKTKDGLRLITAKNVKPGFLSVTPEEFVHPNIYDTWMTRGIPQKGDVLFTTEAPLGNVAQLDTDEKVVFAQRVIILQPDARLIPEFLKYMLLGGWVRESILAQATGVTAQGIKASKLKLVQIPLPPLAEQKRIVKKLDTLSEQIHSLHALQTTQLANLKTLKQSILHEAFAG